MVTIKETQCCFVLFQTMAFEFDKVLFSFDIIVSLPANSGMHNGYIICTLSIIRVPCNQPSIGMGKQSQYKPEVTKVQLQNLNVG